MLESPQALRGWLKGVRILELTAEVNGASVAASLLAGFGATVEWVDLGDPGLPRPGLERLQALKRRRPGRPQTALASGGWDVVIGDHHAARLALAAVQTDWRVVAARVTAWVTPYGLCDVDTPASELTLQADAGIVAVTGHPDGKPVRAGFALGAAAAGMVATTGICASLCAAVDTNPQLVDVATFDALYQFMISQLPGAWQHTSSERRGGNIHPLAAPWNAYPCHDEWVVICTMSERQWHSLCRLIDRPEWADEPALKTAGDRVARRAEIDAALARWTGERTAKQVVELCGDAGISAGPVRTHAQARALCSLRLDRKPDRPVPGTFVPADDTSFPEASMPAPDTAPLDGMRILELGTYTSAPLGTRLLAGLGATVVKAEPARGEACRQLAAKVNGASYLFHLNNTDKTSLKLDIGTPEGRAQLRRSICDYDAIVSNLSRRALRTAGLEPEKLRVANPALLHCMITGFAADSPDSERPAFDTVVQGMAGLMELTGFPDEPPVRVGVSVVDVLGGLAAAAHATAWWYARRRGQCGGTLDLPLMDVAVWACLESATDATRTGNRVDRPWPAGILSTADRPVAWSALGPRTANELSGFVPENVSAFDDALQQWAASQPADEVISKFRAYGLAVAPVSSLSDAANHPAARLRAMLQFASADADADLPTRLLGYPIWLDGQPLRVRRTAPGTPGEAPKKPDWPVQKLCAEATG